MNFFFFFSERLVAVFPRALRLEGRIISLHDTLTIKMVIQRLCSIHVKIRSLVEIRTI